MFNIFLKEIKKISIKVSNDSLPFLEASVKLNDYVNSIKDIKPIVAEIGVIPEDIKHDSTEEKLFAKASDAVLSRTLTEIGLKSVVLSERGDSADVVAKSKYHNYSLVADAKAFRLSRTAKNQKDFKVESLDSWRFDNNFAVLASPYFQYPTNTSQIYKQALDRNVLLFSWEHFLFLLENNIEETPYFSLEKIWNWSNSFSYIVSVSNSKKNFINDFNVFFLDFLNLNLKQFKSSLKLDIEILKKRGDIEKSYWEEEIQKITEMTKQEAIKELLIEKKIDSKILTINKYIGGLNENRYTL